MYDTHIYTLTATSMYTQIPTERYSRANFLSAKEQRQARNAQKRANRVARNANTAREKGSLAFLPGR